MNMQFPFEGMDPDESCLRTAGVPPDNLHAADMSSFRCVATDVCSCRVQLFHTTVLEFPRFLASGVVGGSLHC